MGKGVLVAVVLLTTIYSGILMNVQRNLFNLPRVMAENFIKKETENISDYALRTAVRDASQMIVSIPTSGATSLTRTYTGFQIGNCTIDSIRFRFVTDKTHYQAKTFVRGSLQGINISYPAEIAFNFPISQLIPTPDGMYFQCDQPQFHGSNEYVYDESGNANDGVPMNAIGTRPNGYGVDGWKCASFDGVDDYIYVNDHPMIQVDSTFTLSIFAKIEQSENTACLMWVASDPYDTGTPSGSHPGFNLRNKPTAAMWYTSTPTKQMHFAATLRSYVVLQLDINYTPVGKSPYNKDAWHHFAMTFNKGVLKAYINGVLMGTTTSWITKKTLTPTYGITLGCKDLRVEGTPAADKLFLYGLEDQMGLFRRALTDQEIANLYWGIIKPADLLYIRD